MGEKSRVKMANDFRFVWLLVEIEDYSRNRLYKYKKKSGRSIDCIVREAIWNELNRLEKKKPIMAKQNYEHTIQILRDTIEATRFCVKYRDISKEKAELETKELEQAIELLRKEGKGE